MFSPSSCSSMDSRPNVRNSTKNSSIMNSTSSSSSRRLSIVLFRAKNRANRTFSTLFTTYRPYNIGRRQKFDFLHKALKSLKPAGCRKLTAIPIKQGFVSGKYSPSDLDMHFNGIHQRCFHPARMAFVPCHLRRNLPV